MPKKAVAPPQNAQPQNTKIYIDANAIFANQAYCADMEVGVVSVAAASAMVAAIRRRI